MFSFARTSVAVIAAVALSLTGSASAQTSDVNCVYASWASNGDSQNPCQVWATLGSKCGATFTVPALTAGSGAGNGTSPGYPAPSSGGSIPANDCQCNLVAYSLMAACSWCQDGIYSDSWPTVAQWKAGCSNFATTGVSTTVNATGINVPPFAIQAIDGPWWDPTNAQNAQATLGSSGTVTGATPGRNGAGKASMGVVASIIAIAPLYLLS